MKKEDSEKLILDIILKEQRATRDDLQEARIESKLEIEYLRGDLNRFKNRFYKQYR